MSPKLLSSHRGARRRPLARRRRHRVGEGSGPRRPALRRRAAVGSRAVRDHRPEPADPVQLQQAGSPEGHPHDHGPDRRRDARRASTSDPPPATSTASARTRSSIASTRARASPSPRARPSRRRSPAASSAFDFNPTVDKIRVTSDAGSSLRLNVDEGTLLANDPALNPGMPRVVGSAYANSSFTATKPAATMLYAIDSASDTLSVQNPMTSDADDRAAPAVRHPGPGRLRHRRLGQRRLHRHAHEAAAPASTPSTRSPGAAASAAGSAADGGSWSPASRRGRTEG